MQREYVLRREIIRGSDLQLSDTRTRRKPNIRGFLKWGYPKMDGS